MTKSISVRKIVILLVLLCIFPFGISCNRQSYLPKSDNAYLAALKFSEGLKLEEQFDTQTFEYNLNIKSQTEEQSTLKGFFVICIPDNPNSKCRISISGKAQVKALNTEIPFNKELPLPFVPLKMKLKTPKLPNIPGLKKGVEHSNNCKSLFDLPEKYITHSNNSNITTIFPINTNNPKLPFDPNDPKIPPNLPNLPDFPFDPNDPNFPKVPNIPNLPEYILIELTRFDLNILVISPDKSEKSYTIHGKVEKEEKKQKQD